MKIFTKNIEITALEQLNELIKYDIFNENNIKIMPDVHAGAGCVIGFTAPLKDKIIPNIVGVDIGCGMITIELGKIKLDLQKIDEFITNNIPNGFNIYDKPQTTFNLLNDLKCKKFILEQSTYLKAIGTLGGGNHFIEISIDENYNKYLIIHSGSRKLGYDVAKYYQNLAIKLHKQNNNKELIKRLKSEGKEKEIQQELEKIKGQKLNIPNDLCYLEDKYMQDYLYDMKICQEFAKINRLQMAEKILTHIGIIPPTYIDTIHNYIDFDDMIVRKGAISAKKGEVLLIPINMRDGSILGIGKGNQDWNYSAPHGAGRLMGRKQAKETLSINEFKDTMKHIYTTSVCETTLDEAPMAYKSMEEIIENIKDTVEIIHILKPIYNFKSKGVE